MEMPTSGTQADKEIKQFLKAVISRNSGQRAWNLLGIYGLAGGSLCLVTEFITLFVPFYYGGVVALVVLSIIACAGMVHFFIGRADERRAARLADNTGLQERISTALEGRDSDEPLRVMQKEDACRAIRGFSFEERMPYIIPWKQYIVAGSLLFLCIVCMLFPSPAKDLAKQRHQFAVEAASVEDKIEEAKKELEQQAEDGKIDEESLKKIMEAIDTAEKEIKEANDSKEITASKERLETKLLRDMPQVMSKETAESLQPFVESANLASLADYQQRLTALAKSGDAVAAAMEELKALGELLNDSEKEQLLKALEQAAVDGSVSSEELTSALNNMNNANATYAGMSISQNSSTGNSSAAQSENGQQGDGNQGNGNQGDGQQGNGQQGGGNQGSGQQGGGQQGNGQQGGGQQSGSGTGGGMNQGSSVGMERADGSKDAEKVWIPDSIGNDDNLTGQKSGTSRNKTKTETKGTARAGQKADIGTVSGQYSQKAYSKLDKQKVPESKQELVKKYFSGLE